MNTIVICESLNSRTNLIKFHTRSADTNCLIQGLLSNTYNIFYFRRGCFIKSTINKCQISITMKTIKICSHIHINFVSQIYGSHTWNSVDYTFIDRQTDRFWKTNKPNRSWISSLLNDKIVNKLINVLPCYRSISPIGNILCSFFL